LIVNLRSPRRARSLCALIRSAAVAMVVSLRRGMVQANRSQGVNGPRGRGAPDADALRPTARPNRQKAATQPATHAARRTVEHDLDVCDLGVRARRMIILEIILISTIRPAP